MGRRLNQLCPPYATPSSNSSLDYRRSDARIVENGFATTGGGSKSAKVVLVTDRYPDLHVYALVFTFGLAIGHRWNLCYTPVGSFTQIPWPRRWMRGSSSLARDNS
jgi:hypothetical protein